MAKVSWHWSTAGPHSGKKLQAFILQLCSVSTVSQSKIVTKNGTAFCRQCFRWFLDKWGIEIHLWCMSMPLGNSIVERCHRTGEKVAERKEWTIIVTVYWFNAAPKMKGIDIKFPTEPEEKSGTCSWRFRICAPVRDQVHRRAVVVMHYRKVNSSMLAPPAAVDDSGTFDDYSATPIAEKH